MDSYLQFAHRLFELEDADPGYMALARVPWPTNKKLRFMAAWCTFYNPGIAAKAAEYTGKDFWDYLFRVYDKAPRASERRHFRGQAGLKAIRSWENNFHSPERLITSMRGRTYNEVRRAVRDVAQYGDYFTWKVADVQERVFRIPCDFTGAEEHSPKVPQEGALMIAAEDPLELKKATRTGTIKRVYSEVINHLNRLGHDAPPWYDRPINMQEAETVCCVYHQYKAGDYTYMSRTAKMTKRIYESRSNSGDELMHALHRPHKTTENLLPKELYQWAEDTITNGSSTFTARTAAARAR
jgi:Alpha-glutamyl/putrescinyl thymine pyrophosphorylase clade 2